MVKHENKILLTICTLLIGFMFYLSVSTKTECEVQTIYVTHRTAFYYACGLTSWDMVEWSEPTPMERRRIEKYKGE